MGRTIVEGEGLGDISRVHKIQKLLLACTENEGFLGTEKSGLPKVPEMTTIYFRLGRSICGNKTP